MASVSVVIPAKNESGNIACLVDGIRNAGIPCQYEIVVVDDSTDNTAEIAEKAGCRVVQGQGKGLGQAIIDGIKESQGDVVLVMDADGSHNALDIPKLLHPILAQGYDMVIGSRYVKGGDFSKWTLNRKIKSIIGVKLMQLVTGVRDSNSGFFACRKSILDDAKLNGKTWKIMLEVLFKGKWIGKLEVPITFGDRVAGKSKRSTKQVFKDAINLVGLVGYKWGRFINFAIVGGIGALWYFAILYCLTEYADMWYGFSAIIATLVAITNNYFINHYWTFRHTKGQNKSLFVGWLKYVGNSAIGDGVDWLTMIFMTEVLGIWYMLSAFIASGFACIIKYAIASKFIWGKKGKKADDADYEWHAFFKGLPWQKYSKQNIARVVRGLAGDAGVVLDIGCGASPLGVMVDHSDYIGMDTNIKKIEYMKAKGLQNSCFIFGSCLNIPYRDKMVDTVLFIETIEHLGSMKDVEKSIKEIVRVLKLNGRAIIAMPDFNSLAGRIMERLYGIFQPQAYADQHTAKFDDRRLITLCQCRGLVLERYINLMKRDIIVSFRKAQDG